MAEGQFSTFWWEPCIWCNTCRGRYGVREYQRCCIIPRPPQLSLILCLSSFFSVSIIFVPSLLSSSFLSSFFFSLLSTLSSHWVHAHTLSIHHLVASSCLCVSICEAESRSVEIWVGFVFASRWACHNRIEYFPWSLTLHRAPLFPSALCLDKGPCALLFRGPQALTAEIQAGVIIWTERRARAQSSPHLPATPPQSFMLANSPPHPHMYPQSSHCNLRAPFFLFSCSNKQVIVYLPHGFIAAWSHFSTLLKPCATTWRSYNDPSGLKTPTSLCAD